MRGATSRHVRQLIGGYRVSAGGFGLRGSCGGEGGMLNAYVSEAWRRTRWPASSC
jgi:hypothetical protein